MAKNKKLADEARKALKKKESDSLLEVHTKLLKQHTDMFQTWLNRDDEINQRIDRIIANHEKCKSLKGI